MSDRIHDVLSNTLYKNVGGELSVSIRCHDFTWLIKQVGRARELERKVERHKEIMEDRAYKMINQREEINHLHEQSARYRKQIKELDLSGDLKADEITYLDDLLVELKERNRTLAKEREAYRDAINHALACFVQDEHREGVRKLIKAVEL